jgi:hypothetical protein
LDNADGDQALSAAGSDPEANRWPLMDPNNRWAVGMVPGKLAR